MQSILPALEATNKLFLSGPFGAGKTTQAVHRVRWLMAQERVRGDDILILVPQRTLAQTYYAALRSADMPPGTSPLVTTVAGLARNVVQLYWPLLAGEGGFADAGREPTFLNLETSQYHMGQFVDAALERGDFDGVVVERNRIISQVLDNLNKAALLGFSIDEAYERLELAVPRGEQQTARLNALRAARQISGEFRTLCLAQTLIDFSLQVELFNDQVLVHQWSRTHLFRSRRHLIFDNLEEDTHTAHGLVHAWLPHLDSALLISDNDAGYRFFLGADPEGVFDLAAACNERITLDRSLVMSNRLAALDRSVDLAMRGRAALAREAALSKDEAATVDDKTGVVDAIECQADESETDALDALIVPETEFRFYPQMIGWVVDEIVRLVHDEGVPPGEIAILSPFVSDALRFSLQRSLSEHGIVCTTHRPSRALQDEPAGRCLVTLALLAHPEWGMRPSTDDVTLTLTLAVTALDPVRAHLLSQIVYPPRGKTIELGRFGSLVPAMQERITFRIGEAYDRLQGWLADYRASADPAPLDQFFAALRRSVEPARLRLHQDLDAARIANQLVESARNFRWALENMVSIDGVGTKAAGSAGHSAEAGLDWRVRLGREYVQLFESGALGALYVPGWRAANDAVFLAPAYTFLMRNQAVDVQFWLDIGAGGWWERLYQPLTHPFVLSRRWSRHELWTDAHEYETRQQSMRRLLLGLVRRTRSRIYVTMSDYSESGFEQRGPLMALVNRLLAQKR